MTKHSGRRAAKPARRVPRRQFVILAAGITATLVTWGVLVFAAIESGRQARAGSVGGWVVLGVATVGAAGCLFLTLVLGAKAVEVLFQRGAPSAPPGSTPGSDPGPGMGSIVGSDVGSGAGTTPAPHRAPGRRRATR